METTSLSKYCPVFRNYLFLWDKSKNEEGTAEDFRLAAIDLIHASSIILCPHNSLISSLTNVESLKTYGPFFHHSPKEGKVSKLADVKKQLKEDYNIDFSFETYLAVDVFYQLDGGANAGLATMVFELGKPNIDKPVLSEAK